MDGSSGNDQSSELAERWVISFFDSQPLCLKPTVIAPIHPSIVIFHPDDGRRLACILLAANPSTG